MPRPESDAAVGFHGAGLYEKVRAKELLVALSPDPRLKLEGLTEGERAALESQKYAPTALGQVRELLEHRPVRVPRWYFGGRSSPEVRDWTQYDSGEHQWFIVGPDDVLWTSYDGSKIIVANVRPGAPNASIYSGGLYTPIPWPANIVGAAW